MNRALILSMLMLPPVLSASAGAQGLALKNHDSNAPVDWLADHIEVQDKNNRAILTGNVHVVQADMTIDSPRMTVAYSKATQPGANPQIDRIDASGGVTVVDPSERAKGSYGIYDLNKRLITLIGNVQLVRNGNTVNGARLVMDLNTGRSTVDGNGVGGGAAGATGRSGGRVTGRFTVPQRDKTTPSASK